MENKNKDYSLSQYLKERKYWLNKFSNNNMKTHISYDRNSTDKKEIGVLKFKLQKSETFKMFELCENNEYLIYIYLFSVSILLLHKTTKNNCITILTPVFSKEINCNWSNTILAIFIEISKNRSFKEYLLNIKEAIVKAIENQNYPFKRLKYELSLNNNLSDIAVSFSNLQNEKLIKDINLILNFEIKNDEIICSFKYNSQVYSNNLIANIKNHFLNLFSGTFLNFENNISDIDLMSEDERYTLVYKFSNNNNNRNFNPRNKNLLYYFNNILNEVPDLIALNFDDISISYKYLDEKSDSISSILVNRGLVKEEIIPIIYDTSVEIIAIMLGILKSGAVFLPIDISTPVNRIKYIVYDVAARYVIANQNEIFKGDNKIIVLKYGDFKNKKNVISNICDFKNKSEINELAYVIYTSGTTGNPKGVMIQHNSFIDFILWAINKFEHKKNYKVLLSNSFAFDGAIQQIFPTLLSGGTLYLIKKELRIEVKEYLNFLQKKLINCIDEVPSLLNEIFSNIEFDEEYEFLPHLVNISLGCEFVPIKLVQNIRKYFNHSGKIINAYGPAEATVEATSYEFSGIINSEMSLIGRPRDFTKLYILDENNTVSPIGVKGEICIGGSSIARGYVNKPEVTLNKFKKNIKTIPEDTIYKTGDIGRWLPDGNIEFLGRKDFQINLRGFRIEPSEIENNLLKHPQIIDVIIIFDKVSNNDLSSFIIKKDKLSISEIREYLKKYLPEYMIPKFIYLLDKFPLTSYGKIDREKLIKNKSNYHSEDKIFISPSNELEMNMIKIWSEVLDRAKFKIGVETDFFEIGGYSLNAIKLVSKIRKIFNYELKLKDLYHLRTIKNVVSKIKANIG